MSQGIKNVKGLLEKAQQPEQVRNRRGSDNGYNIDQGYAKDLPKASKAAFARKPYYMMCGKN